MKKVILLLMICTIGKTSFSQNGDDHKAEKKKTDMGILLSGGLNMSRIGGDSESYTGNLPGGYLGAGLSILKLNKQLGVNVGLGYSMEGSKYEEMQYEPGGGSSTAKNQVRLNYLRIPISLRYQSNGGFVGEAGLAPGILLSAKDKVNGKKEDVKDIFNGFDMGIVLGAGYETKARIGFGLRFVPGLTNINKSSGPYKAVKDRNSTISIMAWYKI